MSYFDYQSGTLCNGSVILDRPEPSPRVHISSYKLSLIGEQSQPTINFLIIINQFLTKNKQK